MGGEDDPQNWRLDVREDHIELYNELAERPRPPTASASADHLL